MGKGMTPGRQRLALLLGWITLLALGGLYEHLYRMQFRERQG